MKEELLKNKFKSGVVYVKGVGNKAFKQAIELNEIAQGKNIYNIDTVIGLYESYQYLDRIVEDEVVEVILMSSINDYSPDLYHQSRFETLCSELGIELILLDEMDKYDFEKDISKNTLPFKD